VDTADISKPILSPFIILGGAGTGQANSPLPVPSLLPSSSSPSPANTPHLNTSDNIIYSIWLLFIVNVVEYMRWKINFNY
jgi:hypothetical protein